MIVTSNLPSVPQAFPVLVGDMDNSGSLNAQIIHQLSPGLRSKMAIQVSLPGRGLSPSQGLSHPRSSHCPSPTDPAVQVRELAGGWRVPWLRLHGCCHPGQPRCLGGFR